MIFIGNGWIVLAEGGGKVPFLKVKDRIYVFFSATAIFIDFAATDAGFFD